MVRLEELINGNSGETIEDASRRARKLVNSHATNLKTQFPNLTLFIAKDLPELTAWTVRLPENLKFADSVADAVADLHRSTCQESICRR